MGPINSMQIKHRLAIGAAANCTIPGFINILSKLMVVDCVDTLTVPMEPLSTLSGLQATPIDPQMTARWQVPQIQDEWLDWGWD